MKKEITIREAENLLKEVFNKPCLFQLFYAGIMNIEIGDIKEVQIKTPSGKTFNTVKGDYSFFIEGEWKVLKDNIYVTDVHYQNKEDKNYIKQVFTSLSKLTIQKVDLTPSGTKIWIDDGLTIEVLKRSDKDFSDWYLSFTKKEIFLVCSNGEFFLEKETPGLTGVSKYQPS